MKRAFLVLAILFGFGVASTNAQSGPIQKAPPVTLKDLRGNTVKLADFKGKVVLLNFWATWCPPCTYEMPDLQRWHAEYKDQGLAVIGITYPPTDVVLTKDFAARLGIDYTILLGTTATKKLFKPGGKIPISVIIDRNGNIRKRIDGLIGQAEFDARIKPLLEAQKN